MKSNITRYLSIAAAVMAISSVAPQSQARSVVASAGRAVSHADQGCFGLWYSSMTNYCTTQKTLEIPLTADRSGWFNVVVTAYGASASNNVGCSATGVNKTYTSVWGSPTVYLSSFGSSQDINLTTYNYDFGGMYATCSVQPNGRVNLINWW
jgi:hypothetical protein